MVSSQECGDCIDPRTFIERLCRECASSEHSTGKVNCACTERVRQNCHLPQRLYTKKMCLSAPGGLDISMNMTTKAHFGWTSAVYFQTSLKSITSLPAIGTFIYTSFARFLPNLLAHWLFALMDLLSFMWLPHLEATRRPTVAVASLCACKCSHIKLQPQTRRENDFAGSHLIR